MDLNIENVADMLRHLNHKVRTPRAIAIMTDTFGVDTGTLDRFVGENADGILSAYKQLSSRHDQRNAHRKARRVADPIFRVSESMRARFAAAFKGRVKPGSTFALFGYTTEDLIAHLTPMLRDGMTWANYGTVWEIDHKRPVASFDLSSPDQVRECWALSNLQPMLGPENRTKGAKWQS